MSKRQAPAFLYQTDLGVFYFQKRIPESFRNRTPTLPRLVRLSLSTKYKKDARRLARALSVMLDLRAQQYFKDESSFHEGMKLLQQYLQTTAASDDFEKIQQHLLDNFDDTTGNQSALLESALQYYFSKQIDTGANPYKSLKEKNTESLRPQQTHLQAEPKSENGISLDQAFEDFVLNKKQSWSAAGGVEQGLREVYFPLFKDVVGDVGTDQLTKRHINDYIKVVQRLPSNRSKLTAYRDKHPKDFLFLVTPEAHRIKPLTQKKYLGNIGTFLHWLKSNDYTSIDLAAPLSNVKVNAKRSVDQQAAYGKKDIKKFFESEEYIKGLHKNPSHFWVPLLALYSGARLNEICQLSTQDIRNDEETGRWFIDFNEDRLDNPLKSLKQSFHARWVPVHKALNNLGFLDYVAAQKKAKQHRLFHDLTYSRAANKYGEKLSKWFNRTYHKNCKITTPDTSFHSFRHTVITHLVNDKNVDPNKIAIGMGQTPQGGVTQTTYTKAAAFKDYVKYFDLIDFDDCYDRSKIRRWDKHLFNSSDLLTAVKPQPEVMNKTAAKATIKKGAANKTLKATKPSASAVKPAPAKKAAAKKPAPAKKAAAKKSAKNSK